MIAILIPAVVTGIAAMGQGPVNQPKPDPANLPRYQELISQLNDLEAQKEEKLKALATTDPAFAKARSRKPKIDIEQFDARQSYLAKRKELGDASTTSDFRNWEGLRKILVNSEFNQRFYEESRNRPMSETLAVIAIESTPHHGRTLSSTIDQMLPKESDQVTPDQAAATFAKICKAQADIARPKVASLEASLQLPSPLIAAHDETNRLQAEETIVNRYIAIISNQGGDRSVDKMTSKIGQVATELDRVWPTWRVEHEADLRTRSSNQKRESGLSWIYPAFGLVFLAVGAVKVHSVTMR